MFELKLSVEGRKVESIKLANFDERKKRNLMRGIDRGTLILNRQIRTRKLSGQYLRAPTGTLRSSFHTVRAREQRGVGIYGEVASKIAYARVHEKGFQGIVQRRAHTRRGSTVKAHPVKMNVRARYYARDSLIEKRTDISRGIIRELTRPLR